MRGRSEEASLYRALYKTGRWLKRRAWHLEANPLCVYCLAQGKSVIASVADHVLPHRGDLILFFEGELQSLCASCHSSVKQSEEAGNGRKGFDDDGMPLDPNHAWNRGR